MAERAIWAKNNTDDHKQNTAYKRKRYRRMHGPMHLIRLSGTIKLGNNYSRTTGRPTKKPTRRLIRVLVVPPTAASACLPTKRPTTTASAVL